MNDGERIAMLEERIRGNKELVEQRFKLDDRFLKYLLREGLRRARELNHEARTLKAMQAKYPAKEQVEQQFRTIDQELVKLQVAMSNSTGRSNVSWPLILLVLTVILGGIVTFIGGLALWFATRGGG